MKNGLELKAPVTDDISRAQAFAIKWVAVGIAVSPMLYGLAKLVIALKSGRGLNMSDKLIMLAKILCVIVGISFSLMLVALFLSMGWMMLSSSGLLG